MFVVTSSSHDYFAGSLIQAEFITVASGAKLLRIGGDSGHTFYKENALRDGGYRYKCSQFRRQCRTFAHVDRHHNVTALVGEHHHPPSSFLKTGNGIYIKIK